MAIVIVIASTIWGGDTLASSHASVHKLCVWTRTNTWARAASRGPGQMLAGTGRHTQGSDKSSKQLQIDKLAFPGLCVLRSTICACLLLYNKSFVAHSYLTKSRTPAITLLPQSRWGHAWSRSWAAHASAVMAQNSSST